MTNFVEKGDSIQLVAPYAVASGGGALVGSIFGVATNAVASGATGDFLTAGVFDLTKSATVTPAQGGLAYWDNTAMSVTTVSSGNELIGTFTRAALAGDATTRVRLNGAFIS
jgi:predicted RecA/RadA family phage recombinase